MRAFLKHNSLSIAFLALFLTALILQAFAGHADFNEDQLRHDNPTMSLGRYVISSEFGVAVLENWQSEYLQFTLFIVATVWLLQRGSPESKQVDKAGRESDKDQLVGEHAKLGSPRWAKVADLRRTLYENSLLIVMGAIWLGSPDFWEKTLQNWQSEFLAVGSMAILAVYLRQRGSPESKPVGTPHHATGTDG